MAFDVSLEHRAWPIVVVALLCLQAIFAPAHSEESPANLETLVARAKAEGSVTFYSASPSVINRRVAAAFTAKYGIQAESLRLGLTDLQRRYVAEASAGKMAADLLFNTGGRATFVLQAKQQQWIQPISEAGLPVVVAGEYPKSFNLGTTATIQIAPWSIAYNTDAIKGADVPKQWTDILKPRFKGQILIPDPYSAEVSLDVWGVILDNYGESFFTQLRAQDPRHSVGGIPAIQSLAAGEGLVVLPTTPPAVQDTKEKGAPLDLITPDDTSGVEMDVMLTDPSRSKHPNAARLLANFVMSREGNDIYSADLGGSMIYDNSRMPKKYRSPKPAGEADRKDRIIKLLGF